MVDYPETLIRSEHTRYGKRHRFVLPEARRVPYWEGVRIERGQSGKARVAALSGPPAIP